MNNWRGAYSKYKEFFLNSYQEYTKKEEVKMFFGVILSLFASAFFIFFALQPTVLTIQELLKTIKAKEEIIVKMDEKIKNLETAKALYINASSKIELANFSVPDSPSPETLSQQVEGLSGLTQATITNIAVEQVQILGATTQNPTSDVESLPEGAHGMPFTLNVTSPGNFSSVTAFISSLKNLRRAVKIDKLTLTSSVSEGAQNLILAITGRSAYLGKDGPSPSPIP